MAILVKIIFFYIIFKGITPYISLKMASYNVTKNVFYNENERASAISSIIIGAFSGFLSGKIFIFIIFK